jgi:hypothetical protein
MAAERVMPDWIELARQSIEAQQSEKVRKQIDHFQWLIEQRKAEIKRDMEAMQRGANDRG